MQLSVHTKALSIQNSSALVQVDLNESSVDANDDVQNEGFSQAESIIQHSQVADILCRVTMSCCVYLSVEKDDNFALVG